MEMEEIKKYLKEKDITYEELAKRTGLSISTIKKLFAGISKYPRIDTVEAIEKALGIGGQTLEWTDEDKALGVGSYPTILSERERKWQELGSEVLRVKGEAYYEMLEKMIEAVIQIK